MCELDYNYALLAALVIKMYWCTIRFGRCKYPVLKEFFLFDYPQAHLCSDLLTPSIFQRNRSINLKFILRTPDVSILVPLVKHQDPSVGMRNHSRFLALV